MIIHRIDSHISDIELDDMIEDTLNMSDEDILVEVASTEGDPERIADELRGFLLASLGSEGKPSAEVLRFPQRDGSSLPVSISYNGAEVLSIVERTDWHKNIPAGTEFYVAPSDSWTAEDRQYRGSFSRYLWQPWLLWSCPRQDPFFHAKKRDRLER